MKQPTSPQEIWTFHNLLRSDPQAYFRVVNNWIRENPTNAQAYFDRHFAWMKIGEPQRALDDLNKAVELTPDVAQFLFRGEVYRHLGQYQKALEDFDRAEAIDPKKWKEDIVFGLLFQADAHARLGNERAALASCAHLPDDFWTPGIAGAPSGSKAEVADKLRRVAAAAGRNRA